MNKIIALLLLFSSTAFAVPVTITFNVPSTAYLTDVETSRLSLVIRPSLEGSLSAPINASVTSMSITGVCPAANVAVLIDAEPILVTAGSGTSTCTITRNSALSQANTVAASHSSGAQVGELQFSSAQNYFIRVGVQNFLVDVINGLSANSAVIGASVSSIATNKASIATAFSGAAQ